MADTNNSTIHKVYNVTYGKTEQIHSSRDETKPLLNSIFDGPVVQDPTSY